MCPNIENIIPIPPPQQWSHSTIRWLCYLALLLNTRNKLVRYKHHSNFLFRCVKRSRIPKGLMLSFDLELATDNGNLQESCKQHLLAASFRGKFLRQDGPRQNRYKGN